MNLKAAQRSDERIVGYLFGGFGAVLLIGGILVTITYKPVGNPNPVLANLALAIVLYAVFIIQALFNAVSTTDILDFVSSCSWSLCTLGHPKNPIVPYWSALNFV
jgi:4-hydroxybenzoate polyprenyltransferase